MHVAIAIAACPVCEFKRSVVTNVEPDKIRGSELDDTQLWNVCVASTTIRIYALLLHIHSPHWGGGEGSTSSRKAAEMFRLKLESCSWLSQCWEMVCFPNGPIPGDQCVPTDADPCIYAPLLWCPDSGSSEWEKTSHQPWTFPFAVNVKQPKTFIPNIKSDINAQLDLHSKSLFDHFSD